ncbi:MAG: protein kinase [Kofleriaceae bacterium]|nr:protein kinase [Kofleriaceae bacterium]
MSEFPVKFGRYQLVERLAVGGMAELFVASAAGEHGFAKRLVIKRLLPHLATEPLYEAMFIDEAKLTARLVHPKIAQTHELGKVGEQLYIAMEFVDGIDVLALLRELAHRKERLAPHLAVWIAHEVLDALEYAHNLTTDDGKPMGVVHRDISPSNVLLSARGDVKLVDFGIARARDPERAHKSKSGTLKGKYGYMSPEQVQEVPIDHRSDVFSVGVLLAEMLTGRRLFAAANELDVLLMVRDARLARLDKYGADLEAGLSAIMRRALRKNPDERWPSAAAYRDALGEWMFEQRRRVTPPVIAELVGSMRDAVEARRSTQLKADSIGTAVLEVEGRGDEGGVPSGALDVGDSMPIISLSYEEGGPGAGDDASRARRPSTPAALASDGVDIEFDLVPTPGPVEVPSPAAPAAGTPARAGAPMRRAPSPGPSSLEADALGLGPAGRVAPRAPRDPSAPSEIAAAADLSSRFPSIEAAIESLMPMAPDPSAIDFDDSEVEPHGRSAVIRVPGPEDLVRSKPPTPPTLADIADTPDDHGDFAETPALKLLYRLLVGNLTGLLVVQVGGIKKEIYIRDGQPEFVSSNVASELFGNYLVAKGVLSDGELAMALAMMPHYGGKLGDTVVGLGLLKPLEVFRHLTRQVRSKLIDVCTWSKGTFAWYGGRENPREAFPLDLNIYEVLGAGALAIADDFADDWVVAHRAQRFRPVRTRRIGLDRFELPGVLELDPQLDGTLTVGELVERSSDREERMRTARLLYLLWACELIRG